MEILFELLFQLFGEFILSFVFEMLTRGVGWMAAPWASSMREHSSTVTKVLRALLYLGSGLLCGWLSLFIMPESLARSLDSRLAILIGVPVLCGASMALVGYLRKQSGREAAAIESFGYGFLFAASMSLFRFFKAA